MQKETLSETDEGQEEELIPVEVDPNAAEAEAATEAAPEEAEDKRIAEADAEPDEEGDDDEEESGETDDRAVSRNRDKRIKRRQLRKQAKERTLRELEILRQQNSDLVRRLSSLEGNAINNNAMMLDQRLADANREVEQAEIIIAKAIEVQNGQDVATAMKLRDEARAKAFQIASAKERLQQAAKQQANSPQVDTRVVTYAKEWIEANPWYDPQGRDEDSAITNAIDSRLKAEGYNPASEDYWVELTNRVSKRIAPADEASDKKPQRSADQSSEKRKAPPIGNSREHVPVSTKREIYVSPERKQAMIDAGIWENPEARNKMLKAYRDYDKSSAR